MGISMQLRLSNPRIGLGNGVGHTREVPRRATRRGDSIIGTLKKDTQLQAAMKVAIKAQKKKNRKNKKKRRAKKADGKRKKK